MSSFLKTHNITDTLNCNVLLFRYRPDQLHSENLWFPPAGAGSSPANHQPSVSGGHTGLPDSPAAGFTMPGHGASALGWDRALVASGPGTAGGNLDVKADIKS